MNIGQRIKKRRKELNLSVDDVANKLNKNRATIYRYESNEIENLPLNILEPLAKVLNTTPAALMGWQKEESNKQETQLKAICLSQDEKTILENFNKLNDLGKKEATKRVSELTEISKYIDDNELCATKVIDLPKREKQIWEEPGKEHLMPVACHDDGLTDEERAIVNERINEILKNIDKY